MGSAFRQSFWWTASASALTLTMGVPAVAQEADPAAQAQAGVQEVIVTSQRREERIQDVPISLSAMSGDELQSRRVDNVQDVLSVVPSVTFFTNGGSEERTDVSIRGVSNQGGATSPFALYVDDVNLVFSSVGVQLGSVRGFDANLLDIERVEVLRGPQGTYFGRNAVGGAINVITVKPSTARVEGFASVDVGREGTSRLSGTTSVVRGGINLPAGENLAFRLNGYYEDAAGWIEDIGPANNTNDREGYGGRAAMRYTPGDRLSIDLAVSLSEKKRGINDDIPSGQGLLGLGCRVDVATQATICPFGALSFPNAPFDSGQGFWPDNKYRIATDLENEGFNRTTIVSTNVGYDLDFAQLTVVGGYIRNRAFDGGDLDGTPLSYLPNPAANVASGRNYSLEARLSSAANPDSRWRWIVGANTSDERGSQGTHSKWGTGNEVPAGFRDRIFVNFDAEIRTKSNAVFGEATYRFTDALAGTLGLRYTKDDVETTSGSVSETLGNLTIPTFSVSQKSDDVSPKFSLTYNWNRDLMTYATVSKGYKAGGFAPGVGSGPANTLPFDPETLWNYEIGQKTELFDKRLRLNVAAYYMDWKNIQVAVFDSQRVANIVSNAASGRIRGFELEAIARPLKNTNLGATYSYNDATYGDFDRCLTISTTTTPVFIDCSGRSFGTKHNVTASAEQRFPLPASEAYLRAEYSWRSDLDQVSDIQVTPDPRSLPYKIEGYDTVNLRAGLDWNHWKFELYGENIIGDAPVVGRRSIFSFLAGGAVTPLARSVGGRVRYTF